MSLPVSIPNHPIYDFVWLEKASTLEIKKALRSSSSEIKKLFMDNLPRIEQTNITYKVAACLGGSKTATSSDKAIRVFLKTVNPKKNSKKAFVECIKNALLHKDETAAISLIQRIDHSHSNRFLDVNQLFEEACKLGLEESATVLILHGLILDNPPNEQQNEPSYLKKTIVPPLIIASKAKLFKVASALLDAGANKNAVDDKGNTALHIAAMIGLRKLTVKLQEVGADLNLQNEEGDTPLHLACYQGHERVIKSLLNPAFTHLLDCTLPNNKRYLPLHHTCQRGYKDISLQLLELNKKYTPRVDTLNFPGEYGLYPLHFACLGGNPELVSTLLEDYQADPNQPNDNDIAPLQFAMSKGYFTIALKLIQHGAEVKNLSIILYSQLLEFVREQKNEKIIVHLLKEGKALKLADNEINLTFKHACENKLLLVSKEIIQQTGLAILSSPLFIENFEFLKPIFLEYLAEQGIPEQFLNILQQASEVTQLEEGLLKEIQAYLNTFNSAAPSLTGQKLFTITPLWKQVINDLSKELSYIQIYALISNLIGHIDSEVIKQWQNMLENFYFKIDETYFGKVPTQSMQTTIAEHRDLALEELVTMFDNVNFTDRNKPAYYPPEKLTDEDAKTTPKDLKKGIETLLNNIKRNTKIDGTPLDPVKRAKHYQKYEALLKEITFFISKMPPSERVRNLVDVAVMGKHCGGKIGEAQRMLIVLNKQLPEGVIETIYHALGDECQRIIDNWALEKSRGRSSYQSHEYNQLMFLLGNRIKLKLADLFTESDPFSSIAWTAEEAWEAFLKEYSADKIIDIIQSTLQNAYKTTETREEVVDFFQDHVPPNWQKERYDNLLAKIHKIAAKQPKTISVEEKRKLILHALEKKGIFLWYPKSQTPFEAIEEYAHLLPFETVDEQEVKMNTRLQHIKIQVDKMQKKGATRTDISTYLAENGITMEREVQMSFEDMVQKMRGTDYLFEEVFEIDPETENVNGIKRTAILSILIQLRVLSPREVKKSKN